VLQKDTQIRCKSYRNAQVRGLVPERTDTCPLLSRSKMKGKLVPTRGQPDKMQELQECTVEGVGA